MPHHEKGMTAGSCLITLGNNVSRFQAFLPSKESINFQALITESTIANETANPCGTIDIRYLGLKSILLLLLREIII